MNLKKMPRNLMPRKPKLVQFLRMKKHADLRKRLLPRTSLRLRGMLKIKQKLKLVRLESLRNKLLMKPRLLLRTKLPPLLTKRRPRKPIKRKPPIKLHSPSILPIPRLQPPRNHLVPMKPGLVLTLEVIYLSHNKKKRLPLKPRPIKRTKLKKKLRSLPKLERKKRLIKRRRPRLKSPSLNPNQRANPSQRANPTVMKRKSQLKKKNQRKPNNSLRRKRRRSQLRRQSLKKLLPKASLKLMLKLK